MDILEDVIDSTPIIGHTKGAMHYMTGDSKKGKKALLKSTRSTAVIAGGTAGCMLGPGGAVIGSIYGGVVADTFSSVITEEQQGYIKYTDNFVKDVKRGKNPCKNAVRFGVQAGFDGLTGYAIERGSFSENILANSIHMTGRSFSKKVTKSVVKHSIEDWLSSDDDDY